MTPAPRCTCGVALRLWRVETLDGAPAAIYAVSRADAASRHPAHDVINAARGAILFGACRQVAH